MSSPTTRRRLLGQLAGAGLASAMPGALALAAETPAQLRIASGGVTGIYAAIGAAICRVVEADPVRRRRSCSTVATQGSLGNLRFLRSGLADLAIAQGELVRKAHNGEAPFDVDRANPDLRILFGTVVETLVVVAGPRTSIGVTGDLAGQRVDLGGHGSGGRATVQRLLEMAGLTTGLYAEVLGNPSARQPLALCAWESDAFAYVGANPNGVVQDAIARCDGRLVGIETERLETLIAELPDYEAVTIPAGTYRNQAEDLQTLGVTAFVVADRRLPEALAERVTAAVFGNLAELRRLHLAFDGLDEKALLAPCPDVPYHPGALAFFAKAGLEPPACR